MTINAVPTIQSVMQLMDNQAKKDDKSSQAKSSKGL